MGQARRFLLLCVAALSLVLMPAAANAVTLLQCDNRGNAIDDTALFDADIDNDPNNHSGVCQYADMPIAQHVFSNVICHFVVILNDIMDSMYCGINYYLVNTISVLLTLYLTVYGAQILMGTAQVSTRDSILRMLKFSFIYVFATQSAYGIHFTFQFFIGFMSDASTAVLSALSSNVNPQSDGVCEFDGLESDNVMSMYNFLDYLVCHSFLGPASTANAKVQGLFMLMLPFLAPMTLLFQWWIMTTIKTLVLTLVSFLKAVTIIAFLVTLSPVFLGFFLFQSTTYLFENWLRSMISFSIQVVVVLAIIVFWIMSINQFVSFFNDLSELIYPFVPIEVTAGVWSPSNGWGICDPIYGIDSNTGEPTAKCRSGFNAYPPNWCTDHSQCTPDEYNNTDERYKRDNDKLKPPSEIVSQGGFLYFVFYHLITLLLISYAFATLLAKSDEIAQSLAGGPSGIPALVPGFGNSLGNVNSFKTPASAGSRPSDGQASSLFAKNFSEMLTKR